MRVGKTCRAPADQDRHRELSIGRRGGACEGTKDKEQERRKPDDPLLGLDLEKLIVRIATLESLPSWSALGIRPVSVLEAAGADPQHRMVADHAHRIAPHDDALPKRGSFR